MSGLGRKEAIFLKFRAASRPHDHFSVRPQQVQNACRAASGRTRAVKKKYCQNNTP